MTTEAVRRTVPRSLTRHVNVPGLLTLLGIVAIWQLVVTTGVVRLTFLPAPSQVAVEWWALVASGQLPEDLIHTLSVVLAGFGLGSVLGVALGTWLGVSAKSWTYVMASFDFMRAIPAICFLSIAILMLGLSMEMEIAVSTYAALWVTLVNTVEGIRKVDGVFLETARTLQLRRIPAIFKVVLPAAASSIVVGLRLGLALALTLAIASEMIGNPAGMGYQVVMQQQALRPAGMIAYIVSIGLLGLLLNSLLMSAIRWVLPGVAAAIKEGEQ
jgi:ABC-type nitrate/sulfonate/bicarbonate transport system permease component